MNLGFKGGLGSVLAVTAQNPGVDQQWNTADDVNAPMNESPGSGTADKIPFSGCGDLRDRVRGFAGPHKSGVQFVYADGSARFVGESIDPAPYRALSTIAGEETRAVGEFP